LGIFRLGSALGFALALALALDFATGLDPHTPILATQTIIALLQAGRFIE
jgi:hypothetical protein